MEILVFKILDEIVFVKIEGVVMNFVLGMYYEVKL